MEGQTAMTYADLPAGAELDRLVAERVLGLDPACIYSTDGECLIWHSAGPNTDFGDWDIFSPSSDIAHAWKVVEKLRRDDHMFVIIDLTDCAYAGRIHYRQQIIPDVLTKAETVPLAICRAALVAIYYHDKFCDIYRDPERS